MAIKITGTTVINDSRGLENITDITQTIRKPEVLSPTANETDVDYEGLTIEGSGFAAVFGGGRDYREFQVDLATGDFSTPVVSQQVNSDSLTLTTDFAFDTEHKVRIRDVDLDGNVSEFSDVVNFTTAVDPFSVLGSSISGGFYMGTICDSGTCYYLIVAPNSSGCISGCQWKTNLNPESGFCYCDSGYFLTYNYLDSSTYPAGNWTATRTINGFSDWYLPTKDELVTFYDNGAGGGSGDPLPTGEDFANEEYWSSDCIGQLDVCGCVGSVNMTDRDGSFRETKTATNTTRAVRRVPV